MKMHGLRSYWILTLHLFLTAGCQSMDNKEQGKINGTIGRIEKRNILTNDVNESPPFAVGRPNRVNSFYDLIMRSLHNPEIHSNEGMFYSKWRQPSGEPIEFINNINIRGNDDIVPTWPSRGKRIRLVRSNRFKRQDDGDLFWGARGKKGDDSDVFWGNRGKKDDDPFWENRGKRTELGRTWEDFIKSQSLGNLDYVPNLSSKGHLKVVPERRSEDEKFWGMRGKKNEYILEKKDEEDPFWGNRGKRYKIPIIDVIDYSGNPKKKNEDDPFWGNRGKRLRYNDPLDVNFKKPVLINQNRQRIQMIRDQYDMCQLLRSHREAVICAMKVYQRDLPKDRKHKDKLYKLFSTTINNDEYPYGETGIDAIITQNKSRKELITPEENNNNNYNIGVGASTNEDIIYWDDSKETQRLKRDLGSFVPDTNEPNADNTFNTNNEDGTKTINIEDHTTNTRDLKQSARSGHHDPAYINDDNSVIRVTPNDKFDMDFAKVYYASSNPDELKTIKESLVNNDRIIKAHQNVMSDLMKMLN